MHHDPGFMEFPAMHSRIIILSTLLALTCPLNISHAQFFRKKPETSQSAAKDKPAQDVSLNNLKDAPPAPVLACIGPFAKDTSHARLITEFGERNVTFRDVEGTEGIKQKATVVFDDDPTRRLIIYWDDMKARTKPNKIVIPAPSTWLGPNGIRNGLPVKDLEKINGGAFTIKGFGGIGSGGVSGLKGKFADVPGGCKLVVHFEPGIANPLPPKFAAITGNLIVPSSNSLMRRARAQVSDWSVVYP
jgi:hypothetical protein